MFTFSHLIACVYNRHRVVCVFVCACIYNKYCIYTVQTMQWRLYTHAMRCENVNIVCMCVCVHFFQHCYTNVIELYVLLIVAYKLGFYNVYCLVEPCSGHCYIQKSRATLPFMFMVYTCSRSWLRIHVHGFILVHYYFSVVMLLRKLVWALQESKMCLLRCYTCSSTLPNCHVVYCSLAKATKIGSLPF